MSSSEPGPTLDIAHGDAALSKHLKNSLNLLRKKTDDPEFKSMVDDIIAGRKSLRDTVGSPVFSRVLDPLVGRAVEHYRSLSEQERDELAKTGEQQFEAMRADEEPQSETRPGDSNDDEDFSDQNWLR